MRRLLSGAAGGYNRKSRRPGHLLPNRDKSLLGQEEPYLRELVCSIHRNPFRSRQGIEVAEFRYQPTRWPRPYRFVVVRRPQPEESTDQLTLFKLGKYHYQVLVANLPSQPLNLGRFYNDRAVVELIIRELKGDYPLGRIPTR